jgi:hypothetical protein
MRYLLTIQPPGVGFCYVLNVQGRWDPRDSKNPLKESEPKTGPLYYFASNQKAIDTFRVLDQETRPEGDLHIMEVSGEVKHFTLSEIQRELEKTWTMESYSDAFKAGKLPYRDFDHSLKHIMKATGKLVTMVEEADHGHESFPAKKVSNYLADLIICAVRMASKYPYGEIDIDSAVMARIREKADVPVDPLA